MPSFFFMCISTGDRKCSYIYTSSCDNDGCAMVTDYYPCYTLNTTIVINGTVHTPQLYRSYTDAKVTDYECALYECKTAGNIPGCIKELEGRLNIECYYRLGNERHVYIETVDGTRILTQFIIVIILTVIGGIFDLFFIVLFLLVLLPLCFCPSVHRKD